MEVEIDDNLYTQFKGFPTEHQECPIITNEISYNEFFKNYFLKNQPCLIQNVTDNWESSKLWIKNESPNFSFLKERYGDLIVSTVHCEGKIEYNQKPLKQTFRDYVQYWEDYKQCIEGLPIMYLKDWHLKNEIPTDNFYEVPLYFACDWLNEYLVENSLDDYRFVYMGVKGTWSPFHVDVMTSYSWSSNIYGQKKWILFPPGEETHLTDSLGNLPNDIENVKHNRIYFEIIQNAGDAMFVPSNWHHQVWNIKDTISINHNWINACNLHIIWKSMEKNLQEIKKEIDDCKDMDNFLDHCQVMLKASFNLDFQGLFNILNYIARKRLKFLNTGCVIQLTKEYVLGKNHALFDIISIKSTLLNMINCADLNSFRNLKKDALNLLHDIEDLTTAELLNIDLV